MVAKFLQANKNSVLLLIAAASVIGVMLGTGHRGEVVAGLLGLIFGLVAAIVFLASLAIVQKLL